MVSRFRLTAPCLALLCAVLLGFFPGRSQAAERILEYGSEISVGSDASLQVTETLRVRAEGLAIRRGIYRDFPTTYSSPGGNTVIVPFEVLAVLRDGRPEPYDVKPQANGKRVLIGNPDRFLQPGIYTYTLVYRTARQIGFFTDHDELYWNVTGNGWRFPIDLAWCVVTLPGKARISMTEAFTGKMGERGRDFRILRDPEGTPRFVTTRTLFPGEGFSIVAGWPKGIVPEPSPAERIRWKIRDNAGRFALFAGLAIVLLYYFFVWFRYGRDPRPGTIIPRFEPPEGFSPAAVRYLHRMGYDDRCFTATLLGAAVKGLLTIEQDGHKYFLRRGPKLDFTSLDDEERFAVYPLVGPHETLAVDAANHTVFSGAVTALKDLLKNRYYGRTFVRNTRFFVIGVLLTVLSLVLGVVLDPNLGNLPRNVAFAFVFPILTLMALAFGAGILRQLKAVKNGPRRVSALIRLLFLSLFVLPLTSVLGIMGPGLAEAVSWPLLAAVVLLVLSNVLFAWLLKARTPAGRKAMDEIEGFRLYLSVAEADRLNRLNPPDRTPELFERFLPYALALGVEQEWSEQFAEVFARMAAEGKAPESWQGGYRPSWYMGDALRGFNVGAFASNFGSSFSGAISSASVAPGSSSGFGGGGGGGGGSGGGGGGGGGGGW
jgi:uncharacterized membrane protein YgcG